MTRRSPSRALPLLLALAAFACDERRTTDPDADGGVVGTGTEADPIQLRPWVRVDSPVVDELGDTVWYVIDLEGDGPHALIVEDLTLAFALDVYSTPDIFTPAVANCEGSEVRRLCTLDLAPGRYYVGGTYFPFTAPATYHLTYAPIAPEGTAAEPIDRVVDGATRLTPITDEAPSYYRFVAETAGAYEFDFDRIGGSTGVTAQIFAGADFDSAPVATCPPQWISTCHVSGLRSGTYGLRLTATGAGYALAESWLVRGYGDGAIGELVPFTGAPLASGVDEWSESHYAFTTGPGFAGSYRFSFSGSADPRNLWVYEGADSLAPFRGGCNVSLACEVGNLDPGTTYYVVVPGGASGPYTMSAAPGSLEGSVEHPALLVVDEPHDAHTAPTGSNYYRFTTVGSGPYEIVVEPIGGASVPDVRVFVNPDFTTDVATTSVSPVLTSPLDAARTYYVEIDSAPIGDVRITVRKATAGEGSLQDPIALALGDARATTLADGYPSYYAYTTGAVPPATIAFYVRTANGVPQNVTVSPMPTRVCQLGSCLYSNLAPNTTYTFTVTNYFDERPAIVRLADLSVASGCDANALVCLDFESGAPTTTQPAYSVDGWDLTSSVAATGGSSFVCGSQASNDERTCFTYTVPGVSTLAWFSVREISDMPGGFSLVTTDGDIPDVAIQPYASGVFRRAFASSPPATDRGWTFCYRKNGSGQSLDTAWLDDIQFE